MDVVAHRVGINRLPVWAGIFVVLVCGVILASSGWAEWTSRDNEMHNAEVELGNLTRSLIQHVEDTIELADATLGGVVYALETDDGNPSSLARLRTILKLRKPGLGRIRGVFAYDETGRWLATTEDVSLTDYNNSDRDYFDQHRKSADRSVLVGRPVRSRTSGQWVITLSRRWNHPNGRFAGVIAATVDVAYFSQFYRQFNVGPHGTITLTSQDGAVLAHSADTGGEMLQEPFVENIPFQPTSGIMQFHLLKDGFERVGFYQRTHRYPLLILVTRTRNDVLAQWIHDSMLRISVVVCLLILIVAIGVFLIRQLIQGRRMAMALASQEENFRLLAEGSSDIVARIGLDERMRYISPSVMRVLGWQPQHLIGRSALAGLNPIDLPHVQEIMASLKRGDAEEARATYRIRRRDSSEIWVESTLRATRKDNGELDGFVAITRDVTQQKTLQGKLEILAIEDGLTGLANRRRFDERLLEEWGRAYRERTSLALLMIDIDHFKGFNDSYGHPAGDECLHTVAGILADEAQRSSDLAARYGGEEFAILLPNTDAAGCTRIGERIRRALREAAITHCLNLPTGMVTASIGGAICRPGTERSSGPASLIEAADRALYAAKVAGRDRLIISGEMIALPSSMAPAAAPA